MVQAGPSASRSLGSRDSAAYAESTVLLEFGARSTGEPASLRDVTCDALGLVEGVGFPAAQPRVMHAERTFGEKATAMYVFCLQQRLRGGRFSRHWHDVVRLDEAGFVDAAIKDRSLADSVARHKSMFFAEKAGDGSKIDYARMVEDGLLPADAETFEMLMERNGDIALRVNQVSTGWGV